MIDWEKINYSCDGQMTLEECAKEMQRYKWESGQYMNLPEVEVSEDEYNRIYPERNRKRNIPEKSLHKDRVKRSRGSKSD